MQKLESSLKNMVLVLVGVALVVGAVLAYINHLTSGPIAEKAAQSLAAGIKSVMGTEELQVAEPEEVKQEFGGKEFSFTIHKCSVKAAYKVELDKKKLDIKEAIKTLGTHDVIVRVHPSITSTIKVHVVEGK